MPSSERLPSWLRVRLPQGPVFGKTRRLLEDLNLATVCQSAQCPNIFECFDKGTATFLLLGRVCTRNCAFCKIGPGDAGLAPPDPDEPRRVAEAAARLGLDCVVMTSVTRDDLPDGGAGQFAAAIRAVRERLPLARVEALAPDFQGDPAALATVLEAGPHCCNHNLETVPALYPRVRPQAAFDRSLALLRAVTERGVLAKTGLMVGLGENDDQVRETIAAVAEAGVAAMTIGQYLPPSRRHMPAARYVHPDIFSEYAAFGRSLGVRAMQCGPRVRSSYHALETLESLETRSDGPGQDQLEQGR